MTPSKSLLCALLLVVPIVAQTGPAAPTNLRVVVQGVEPALPAPTNLRFEGGAIITSNVPRAGYPQELYPRLRWDPVPGAFTYEVKFTWSNTTAVIWHWLPVMGERGAPFPMGQPGHQYRAFVRACKQPPPSAPSSLASDTQGWFGASCSPATEFVVER